MCQCFSLPYSPSRICVSLPSPPILSRRNLRSTASAMHSNPSPPLPSQHHRQTQEQSRQQAIEYHDQTKHSLTTGYARGPRGLDWANQPNPFLRFLSAPLHPLLHFPPLPGDSPLYHSLFSSFPSPPHPVSRASLSRLLYDSLSLSAWKTTGFSTWSLRVNPSSGNLHPTEAHLLSPPLPDGDSPFSSSSFLTHYSPKDHSLELHAHLNLSSLFPDHGGSVLLLALSSIFWHEAWKYGERALRYCNHDVGHTLAAFPSAGTPTSSMASAMMTSTSSPASTTPTLRRLPSSWSTSFAAASYGSGPSIRTASSSSSPSAPCPYGRAVPDRRARFFKTSMARFNGSCRHGRYYSSIESCQARPGSCPAVPVLGWHGPMPNSTCNFTVTPSR